MHVATVSDRPGVVAVHWHDDCLAIVVSDPDGRAVAGFGCIDDAHAEAAHRGALWSSDAICLLNLTPHEQWLVGGCAECHRGPCSIALMPDEACPHGCGCHGPSDEPERARFSSESERTMPASFPPRWLNGHDGWTYDSHLGVHRGPDDSVFGAPDYCWGDRLVHPDYGAREGDVVWRGSDSHNWHGQGFKTRDEALAWLRGASFTEAGCALWSVLEDCDKLAAAIVAANRRNGNLPNR